MTESAGAKVIQLPAPKGGYVRHYRALYSDGFFRDHLERSIYAYLYAAAAYEAKTVEFRGQKVALARGQVAISAVDVARQFRVSEPTVRRFLDRLEEGGKIIQVVTRPRRKGDETSTNGVTSAYRLVTLLNYDRFQPSADGADEGPDDALTTVRRDPVRQNKEEKESKKDKEPSLTRGDSLPHSPLSLFEPDEEPTPKRSLEELFDEWYRLYPRKEGRGAAERAFRRAMQLADFDELVAGVKRYAARRHGQDPQYTAHPATWLNQKRWLDTEQAGEQAERGKTRIITFEEVMDAYAKRLG